MSAHLCTTQDIHVLVDWARSIPPRDSIRLPMPPAHYLERCEITMPGVVSLDPRDFPTAFGRFLLLANWESLEALYPGRADAHFGNGHEVATYLARRHAFMYAATPGKADQELGFILKQLAHYEYQACEVADWPDTWAARAVQVLRREAITRLSGYRAAPWGLPA